MSLNSKRVNESAEYSCFIAVAGAIALGLFEMRYMLQDVSLIGRYAYQSENYYYYKPEFDTETFLLYLGFAAAFMLLATSLLTRAREVLIIIGVSLLFSITVYQSKLYELVKSLIEHPDSFDLENLWQLICSLTWMILLFVWAIIGLGVRNRNGLPIAMRIVLMCIGLAPVTYSLYSLFKLQIELSKNSSYAFSEYFIVVTAGYVFNGLGIAALSWCVGRRLRDSY